MAVPAPPAPGNRTGRARLVVPGKAVRKGVPDGYTEIFARLVNDGITVSGAKRTPALAGFGRTFMARWTDKGKAVAAHRQMFADCVRFLVATLAEPGKRIACAGWLVRAAIWGTVAH